jgi:hypothetical protein
MVHCDPQSLHYNLVNMHKLNPNMLEVIAFPNWLSARQNLQKLCCIAIFGPLKQILSVLKNFSKFADMYIRI